MKVIYKLALAIFTLATALTSCSSWIYDNPDDCPQGVYLRYYAQSTCKDTIANFYSDFGKAASLTIFAFDQKDKLVSYRQVDSVDLTKDYHYLYPIQNGRYYFRTWVNATKADLKANSFVPGVTTPNDLAFGIRQTLSGELLNIDTAMHIWQGRSDSVIFLPDPKNIHTEWYDTVATSLNDQTKKVRVTLEGLPADTLKKMRVYLNLENTAKNIDGTTRRGFSTGYFKPNWTYYTGDSIDNDSTSELNDYLVMPAKTASYDFKILSFDLFTVRQDKLVIESPTGTILLNEALISVLLNLNRYKHREDDQLECDYNYHVRVRLRYDERNYISVESILPGWQVHAYETDLNNQSS